MVLKCMLQTSVFHSRSDTNKKKGNFCIVSTTTTSILTSYLQAITDCVSFFVNIDQELLVCGCILLGGVHTL